MSRQQNLSILLLLFFSFVELNLSTTTSSISPNIKELLQYKGENKTSLSSLKNDKEQVVNKKGAAGGHGGGSGGGRGVGGGNSNSIHHPANNNKKSNGASLDIHPLIHIIVTFSLILYMTSF